MCKWHACHSFIGHMYYIFKHCERIQFDGTILLVASHHKDTVSLPISVMQYYFAIFIVFICPYDMACRTCYSYWICHPNEIQYWNRMIFTISLKIKSVQYQLAFGCWFDTRFENTKCILMNWIFILISSFCWAMKNRKWNRNRECEDFMVCFTIISMHRWWSNTFDTLHIFYWAQCQTFSSVLINYTFGIGHDIVFLWNLFFYFSLHLCCVQK